MEVAREKGSTRKTRKRRSLVCSMARTPIKFQAGPRDLLNDVADVVPVHGYEARRLDNFQGKR